MTYNPSNALYLFYGNGSEYSLSPIAKYMKEKDYNVLEINLLFEHNAFEIIQSIKGRNVVFITSAHLFFDKKNFEDYTGFWKGEILSPLEIIDYIKPVRSFYYPHDLVCFLHEQEWKWLDLFYAVMVPFKNNDYYFLKKYTKVYDTGWVKKFYPTKQIKKKGTDFKIVYFPSYLFPTPSLYYKKWKPLFDTGIEVKLPMWSGFDDYYNMLVNNDVKLIDPRKTVFDLIDEYDLIIAAGASSVLYEVGMSGRPVISVFKDAMTLEEYNKILPEYTWFYKVGIKEAVELIDEVKRGNKVLCSGADVLKPINFTLVEKIITGTM